MARRKGGIVAELASPRAVDRVFLRRACELAARGRGSTSPNPAVGAVIVRGARTLGEGYHHVRGAAHAEVEALRSAGDADLRDATLYVSLEPCDHTGLTPPCTRAVIEAGVARVVVGALDPNPKTAGAGVARLREAGIAVDVLDEPSARALIEDFSVAVRGPRPYVQLKLAASLDGYVAAAPGPAWLTGARAREYVRELRATHDAVLVGAGTVRIDDPLLTVRPPRARRRPYLRVVACERAPVAAQRRVFEPLEGYARSLVLAPAGLRDGFGALEAVADVLYCGAPDARELDLAAALVALKDHGVASVLCEGGPTLAARLLEGGLVDRLDWLIAPVLLRNPQAVPALGDADVRAGIAALRFERVERLGDDLLVSAALSGG
ncbi:MAG: bifunctional diaminohydroxyphosphoribosylaminopyrimidine deaminase/5-amino-6-(5-phosphoribosylamino)uracil reductase RibD [Vulcanimicrobiaceae bacterium]